MGWQTDNRRWPLFGIESRPTFDALNVNAQCFIRKDHKCGKLFGASKSCFIACPTDDDLEPIIELMSEKLSKVGIEPIIAVKERAYGQDIFCTKICGKVIEARFCIVILDDTVEKGKNIPNPNVYYEYGLMTSLRKHIIPLQKENLKLAFNIQSYDTIKYSAKNISTELDRAIKDAIRITEAKEQDDIKTSPPEKTLLRRLELSGFALRDHEWFLYDVISDTNFKGFGQYEKKFYLYLGYIVDLTEFQDCLDDLGVVIYRTNKKIEEMERRFSDIEKQKNEIMTKMKTMQLGEATSVFNINTLDGYSLQDKLKNIETNYVNTKGYLELTSTFYIGFVINPNINSKSFIYDVEELLQQDKRYKLCYNRDDYISIGGIDVSLASLTH